MSLVVLALLAWFAREPWFYGGLGIPDALLAVSMSRPGVALELFLLALPVFTFVLEPLSALYSRKHEFEADAYATRNADAVALTRALVKLYEDNAATLTPDPLHSAFYDSHPPAAVRIAHIEALVPGTPSMRTARTVHNTLDTRLLALVSMHCREGARHSARTNSPRTSRRWTAGSAAAAVSKDLPVRQLHGDNGLRQRAGLYRPSRRPPSRLAGPLQPLRGRVHDPQRRGRHAERRHLRGQSGTSARLTAPRGTAIQDGTVEGLVVATYRRHYAVTLADGETVEAMQKGRSLQIACGDRVGIARMAGGGAIESVAPRTSLLYRSDAFREKLIAANVTQIVGVVAPGLKA